MTQEDHNKLVIKLLINIQSQFQTFRDMMMSDMADRMKLTQSQKEMFIKKIELRVKEAEKETLNQIALYHEGKFGSIDDLLNGIT